MINFSKMTKVSQNSPSFQVLCFLLMLMGYKCIYENFLFANLPQDIQIQYHTGHMNSSSNKQLKFQPPTFIHPEIPPWLPERPILRVKLVNIQKLTTPSSEHYPFQFPKNFSEIFELHPPLKHDGTKSQNQPASLFLTAFIIARSDWVTDWQSFFWV